MYVMYLYALINVPLSKVYVLIEVGDWEVRLRSEEYGGGGDRELPNDISPVAH